MKRGRRGKIIEWLAGAELAEDGFLCGERLAGRLVGLVCGEPQLAAECGGVIVKRREIDEPRAGTVVAIQLVIAHAHDYARATCRASAAFGEALRTQLRHRTHPDRETEYSM